MKLSMGIGLTPMAGASASAPYHRTDNALSSMWKAPFAGDPWVPSVGAAGNLVTGASSVTPTVGTAQNGLAPAAFDGATQALQTAGILSQLFTATKGGLWVLFFATSGSAPGAVFNESALLMDTGGDYFALSFTTSGVRFTISDGAYKSTAYIACTTGSYHLAQAKWDGSVASLRLDGSAAVTIAAGNLADLTRSVRVGANYTGGGLFWGGRILEIGTKAYAPTAGEENADRGDINTVYGLSL